MSIDPQVAAGPSKRTVPAFTPEQLLAIEHRDGSLLLSANAGSGKTSVIVERFARAVVEDGVSVDQILALSFTEKAAGELRERVGARLSALGAAEAARETETAAISTIHGFCARLLRAHALAAGLDPYVTVLDEREARALSDSAFDAALADLLAAGGDAALAVIAAYEQAGLGAVVQRLHGWLRARGERPLLPDAPPGGSPLAAREALRDACAALASELGSARALATIDQATAVLERCARLLEEPAEAVPFPHRLDALALPGNGSRVPELATEAGERYRTELDTWRRCCADYHATAAWRVIAALLAAYDRHQQRLKRERSALDFTDLELRARDLLRGDRELRERIARSFTHVMVDEFQDVNPLQFEIIGLIARDNLFAVGDPLQSIYSFRHADVEIFRRQREALAGGGATAELRTNFRSRRELLDALNVAFATVFELHDWLALEPARQDEPDSPEPPVELIAVESRGWDELDLELGFGAIVAPLWRQIEARLLAERVHSELEHGRPAGEVVVLLRATGDISLYERALSERGIPTYVVGGRGFWDQREVSDLLAYLAVLANPRDELRLYELLASPFAGVSTDAFVILGAAVRDGDRDAWSLLSSPDGPQGELSAADLERVECLLRLIAAERPGVGRHAIEQLIARALARSGFEAALLARPGGPRRLANVRKLMRLAREHEALHGPSLRAFVDRVQALASDPAEREGEAPLEPEGPAGGDAVPAVRLMTIHRAKGLEFPVVCVADLGRARPSDSEVFKLSADGRVGAKLLTLDGGARVPAFAFEAIAAAQASAADAEERRLFYVAMTRAQERLILSGALEPRSPLKWVAPALAGDAGAAPDAAHAQALVERDFVGRPVRVAWTYCHPDTIDELLPEAARMPVPIRLPPPATTPPTETLGDPARGATPDAATGGTVVPRLSYSALALYDRCGYRFYLQRVLGLADVEPPLSATTPARRGLSPLERGNLAHLLLEQVDLARPQLPTGDEIATLAHANGLVCGRDDAADLLTLLERFFDSRLSARLASATSARREAPFVFSLDPDQPRSPLIVGALDVLARERGGAVLVVDYKTDTLDGTDPATLVVRHYAFQQTVYALAALRAGAVDVEVAHCFLERPDDPVCVSYRAADDATLSAVLRARADGIAAQRFAPTARPHRALCATCPGRAALCSWSEQRTLADDPGAAE